MFTKKIPKHTKSLLAKLGSVLPPKTYLAGGTALSLHLGHRQSFDLDFFSPSKFEPQVVIQRLERTVPQFKLISTSRQTIIGVSEDTEISLFYYHYPLLNKTVKFNGLRVVSIADIACMKLEAVAGRGQKRDFYDFYTICNLEGWSLEEVIDLDRKKYSRASEDLPHLLKSLVYFTEAEKNPERAEIVETEWRKVKKYFAQETQKLAATWL